jgi:hypothetical protein
MGGKFDDGFGSRLLATAIGKAIEKTILRFLGSRTFSHSLGRQRSINPMISVFLTLDPRKARPAPHQLR